MRSSANFPSAPVDWLDWKSVPWLDRAVAGSQELQLCLRLLEGGLRATGEIAYLKAQLPEIASEFAANWVGVVHRQGDWARIAEFGRLPIDALPRPFLIEAADRGAAGITTASSQGPTPWTVAAAPLFDPATGELLAICGRGFDRAALPALLGLARAAGWGLSVARRQDAAQQRAERSRTLLKLTTVWSGTQETQSLLEQIAHEAARLLNCDRSSVFIWDREHRELVGCPALGLEQNRLRISDRAGIVGECFQTTRPVMVDDAYQDERFNRKIDAETGYRTRSLLCVPLCDANGQCLGVLEAINKQQGDFTAHDVEVLGEIGMHAAIALQSTQEREQLVLRQQQLTEQLTQGAQIIGQSPAIVALRETVERLAGTDLPVLVLGESGTGKEVVAQALHYRGSRRDRPFIAVNCAALTESLLESELFGHEKGAFTDAHEARQGKFELAQGGTLFLDEIGDMSLGGQAKLLRVLEQKVVMRVGGTQTIRTNVRVVAATNSNLTLAVRERRFREDLYYRLSVVALDLPPLRDRPEDVQQLSEFFLNMFSRQAGRKPLALSAAARKRLQGHPWPGNIRELRNLMERVAFLTPRERTTIEANDLAFILSPERDDGGGPAGAALSQATAQFQRDYIRRIIKRVNGNMSQAAEVLGLHRSNLYRKMRHLNMSEAQNEPDL